MLVYHTKRSRQRRRLAEIQRSAERHNSQQPRPRPNSVTEPMYQMAGTPWAQPTQGLPDSSRIPSYYADNSSATNMISRQNQQRPHQASDFSLQRSTTTHSEFNSTNGGSSDYHAQPLTASTSTHRQGINTPWAEGSNASESHSDEMSGVGLGRQNTKAQYRTATQREEEAWEAKRREAHTVGTRRVARADTRRVAHSDTRRVARTDTIASTAPVNTPRNGGGAGWATDDLDPIDSPVTGDVPDAPPPAYSEHHAI